MRVLNNVMGAPAPEHPQDRHLYDINDEMHLVVHRYRDNLSPEHGENHS